MKKILLIMLPFLAFAFISKAQLVYTITTDTSYTNFADDGNPQKAKFNIKNETANDITFEWQLADSYIPFDWTAPGICDWDQCYGFEDRTWHSAIVPANDDKDLYIEISRNPNVSAGCAFGIVNYREQGQSAQQTELKHTSHANFAPCGTLSAGNIVKEAVSVYPNPTHNVINLNVLNTSVKSVQLSNLIGKQIQSLNISSANGGVHQMSMQALPKGIYVLQFKNAAGKVLGVTRITKR